MSGPAQLAGFGLGRCFEVFKVSAFRLETLSTYAVPAEESLRAFRLGLPRPARGPLTVSDLATLTGSHPWKVRGILDGEAARILQQVRPADAPRYTFAHDTLLARCQEQGVGGPGHTRRIEEWAAVWQARGWPTARDGEQGTPLYLLDRYPQTLYGDPPRLAGSVGDAGWVTAAIQTLGIDAVLAELRKASDAAPGEPRLAAMQAVVRGQAHRLHEQEASGDPGFVPRQLCLQAVELGETLLADSFRARLLASGGSGPVLQWTTRRASPALILELGRLGARRVALAVLPDGRVVSGRFDDGLVVVWDPDHPATGPAVLGRHGGVMALAVLPDGRVVSGGVGDSGRMLVWDPDHPGTGPAELSHNGVRVSTLAALRDGRVVSDDDELVVVWDPDHPATGPVELGHHKSAMTSALAALPDGRVVSNGRDGRDEDEQVLVWDPGHPGTGPVELGRVAVTTRGWVLALAALPDGRVVSGGSDWVLVWDPDHPGTGPAELCHDGAQVMALAALPDGRVVSGGRHGWVLVWDPDHPGTGPAELGRHDDQVLAVAALPDGRVVSVGGPDDRRVAVWDPTGQADLGRYDRGVTALAVLPDGRVVSGGRDGLVLVWDQARLEADPAGHDRHAFGQVTALAALPDGRLVSGGWDGRVLVWNPGAARRPVFRAVDHPRGTTHLMGTTAVAATSDGRVVSGGRDGLVRVWDLAAARPRETWWARNGRAVTAVAVMSDGRVVTGDRDGRVAVWNPGTARRRPVELGDHYGGVMAVAVLPDGQVVTGGRDGRVLAWNLGAARRRPVELGRHHDWVLALAALPDGRVVSGGLDERVQLWDVSSSSPGDLLACSMYALAVAPSPSGARLFIGHAGGGISCWKV